MTHRQGSRPLPSHVRQMNPVYTRAPSSHVPALAALALFRVLRSWETLGLAALIALPVVL